MGNRIAPLRFVLFALLFGIGLAVGIPTIGAGRGTMAAFAVAAIVFLLSLSPLLRSEADDMRAHAKANDANRAALLGLTGLVMTVILVAVASELQHQDETIAIVLIVATLALAWLFSNTVYALHYAHLFYLAGDDGKDSGGIDFPGCDEPDYSDFLYFSYTLGTTFQTSDVEIAARSVRRVATGHCLAAFVFNLGVLAFTINVLGG